MLEYPSGQSCPNIPNNTQQKQHRENLRKQPKPQGFTNVTYSLWFQLHIFSKLGHPVSRAFFLATIHTLQKRGSHVGHGR
jgi:hypothetical protein